MITVVKIGGNVVDNEQALQAFCHDFARLEGPKVLVHGGGVMASRMLGELGIESRMVEGRRVTDEQTLRVVTMVYAGWCNKHITALLQAEGCNAIGMSGCDGNVIKASKRAPRTLSDGVTKLDYGFVGDVKKESVNAALLEQLCSQGLVPVLCAINHDGTGQMLNTNADTVASAVSSSLSAKLYYCFEKNGVLYNRFDDESVIPLIDRKKFEELKASGVIADGMLPKIENAFRALDGGTSEVVIKNSAALLADSGTRICK